MPFKQDTDYDKVHQEIDEAIEESVQESPASLGVIAENLNKKYHKSLIRRRFMFNWKRDGGRWVRKHNDD